jgi:hypothetical protein
MSREAEEHQAVLAARAAARRGGRLYLKRAAGVRAGDRVLDYRGGRLWTCRVSRVSRSWSTGLVHIRCVPLDGGYPHIRYAWPDGAVEVED